MKRSSNPSPFHPPLLADNSAEAVERAAFVDRLKAIAEMVGSVSALAKRAGLSQAGLRSYLHSSDPTRLVVHAIADAAGVSRNWLDNGDVAMLGPDSPLRAEALRLIRDSWDTFSRGIMAKGGAGAAWSRFVASYRENAEGLGVPQWVRFAFPALESVRMQIARGAAADSRTGDSHGLTPTQHSSSSFNLVGGDLLAAVSREWRRLVFSKDSNPLEKELLGDAYDEVLASAYRDLSAISSKLDQDLSIDTIRAVLKTHLCRLDPVAGDSIRHEAAAELVEV